MKRFTKSIITLPLLIAASVAVCQSASAAVFQEVHSFPASPQYPKSELVEGADGNFYGTTWGGGAKSLGAVYKMTPAGDITTLVSFNGSNGSKPGSLIKGTDGNFYGTTEAGGTNSLGYTGSGTVFKMTPAGQLTTLFVFEFVNGSTPYGRLTQGSDGNFYGTTYYGTNYSGNYGTVYKITPDGQFTTMAAFSNTNGANPVGGVVQGTDGNFYGTTYYGGSNSLGTVFKMTPAGELTALHHFSGSDGGYPYAALFQATNGSFYGTTYYGGTNSLGTIFKITSGGEFTSLASCNYASGYNPYGAFIQGSDGNLYGTAYYGGFFGNGSVLKVTLEGEVSVAGSLSYQDGYGIYAGVMQASDGNFYGTTYQGGSANYGTVFRMTPAGQITTLAKFKINDVNISGLTKGSDGSLYGTTSAGGTDSGGSIFRITSGGEFSELFSFSTANSLLGYTPFNGLVEATDGNFYGTTTYGGLGGSGTVFRMSSSGEVTNLASFSYGTSGSMPYGRLLQASDGNLYGTTTYGGEYGGGTIFKVTLAGELTLLESFDGTNGWSPFGGLTQGADGSLYGAAQSGGTHNKGTIFKITTEGALTILADFDGTNGSAPNAELTLAADGNFYGTTKWGGTNDMGIVFKVTPAGVLTTLLEMRIGFSMDGTGVYPLTGVIQGSDGLIYGTTSASGPSYYDQGTVFALSPGGSLNTLYAFNGSTGSGPKVDLVEGNDGNLYGAASGGTQGGGVIFRIINNLPLIQSQPESVIVNAGATAEFTVTATSATTLSYQWQKNESNIPDETNSTLTLTGVTFEDEGDYRVIVSNEGGSVTSSTATLTVHAPFLAEPVGLRALGISQSAIALSWTNNATNATGLIIWRGDWYNTITQKVAAIPASSTTFTNIGLASSTLYFYSIQATNEVSVSAKSDFAGAYTFSPPPPAPTSLVATARSTNSIALSWVNNATNAEGIVIWRGPSSGSITQKIATVSAYTTGYTNTGLATSTLYFYSVQATNHHESSAKSASASARTFDALPGTPPGLTATALSTNTVKIIWSKPAGVVSNYYLWRGTNASSVTTLACITPSNITGFTNMGLLPNTTYYFSVQAKNSGGYSPKSSVVSVRTMDFAPAAPKSFSARATAPNRALLSWQKGSTNTAGYIVYRSMNSVSGFVAIASLGSAALNYLDNVHSGLNYYYYVKSTNASGSTSSVQAMTAQPVGIADNFLWYNTNGQFSVWVMNGTNFHRLASLPKGHAANTGWRVAAIGDLNSDFSSDLIWQNKDGRLMSWLLNGTNLTRAINLKSGYAASTGWRIASAPDLNGDGKIDFLWAHTNGQTAAWIMNGTNYVSYVTMRSGGLTTKQGWSVLGSADFTSDNNADIVWQNTNGTAAAWIMSRTNYLRSVPLRSGPTPATAWRMSLLTDLTSDKKPELIWQNNNGSIQAYIMNGTNYVKSVNLKAGYTSTSGWQLVGPR